MAKNNLSIVTGANGHLGNNLVRLLINKGIPVRASVRNINNKEPFQGLNCEVVKADLMDKGSLVRALKNVDTFYAVGAVYKLWAKNQEKEIYDVNIQGTINSVEAAVEAGVRRIVYVSSIAALNFLKEQPIKESYGFNPDRRNWYYNSKNDAEIIALELAAKNNIELVSVLPSAMIGSDAFKTINVSYNIIALILNGEIPVETNISLNWVDGKDVAEGCYLAATKGRNLERYILASECGMSLKETIKIAQEIFPELKLKLPIPLPKFLLYSIAALMELGGKLTGKAPLLSINDIAMFSGLKQNFDISKARNELGYNPKPPKQAVIEAMQYLMTNKQRLL